MPARAAGSPGQAAHGPVLALEASTLHVGVALLGPDGEPWGRIAAPPGSRGTALLASAAAELLAARGLAVRELGGIVVGTGPGSYTGTRAAIAFARALVFAAGVPLAGVPSVAGAALGELRRASDVRGVIVLIDARRGEVYRADYARAAARGAAGAAPGAAVGAAVGGARASAAPVSAAALVELLPPRLVSGAEAAPPEEPGISVLREPVPEACDVAAVGRERLLLCGGDAPESVLPLYLKRSHAEIVFEERAGSSEMA